MIDTRYSAYTAPKSTAPTEEEQAVMDSLNETTHVVETPRKILTTPNTSPKMIDGYNADLIKQSIKKNEYLPMNYVFYQKGKKVLEARLNLAKAKYDAVKSESHRIAVCEAELALSEFELEHSYPGMVQNGYFFKRK